MVPIYRAAASLASLVRLSTDRGRGYRSQELWRVWRPVSGVTHYPICLGPGRNWNTFQFCRATRYADGVSAASTKPAVDGWFATDGSGEPYLIGGKCHQCGTYVFPPRANNCPNPACDGDELAQVPLSRRGTLWSYTENRYAPPPPYPSPDPFEPFAVAAVQLADEGLIVLGKVVEGTLAADLKVGMEMELTTMPLFVDDDGVERIVYAWRIAS
jgi:uncharacterized OB-fold protein